MRPYRDSTYYMKQAISAGHEITLAVAKEILLAKGNAFDAAIAAHFAMFITEPCMASAGGNGFALAKPANKSVQFFDFFCQTPIEKNIEQLDFYPIVIDFGGESEEFHVGLGAAAVPGSIAGVFALHQHYGTMPIRDLVQPAIQLAKEGVIMNAFQSYDLGLLEPIYKQDPSVKDIFFKDERIVKEGDLLQMPGMADFLNFIAQEGERGFYQGEIAQSIAADSAARGGFLRRADFENYKVNIGDAFAIPYKNKRVYLPNGPSKGGAAMALMFAQMGTEQQALALAIKRAQLMISDENNIKSKVDALYPGNNFNLQVSLSSNRGTSHFNIVDRHGNAIALTSSIGEGCGYFIPGTDMQLNNMLGEIFLLPNGAHSWTANTRLHSMMTPTMLTDQNGQLEFVAGSGGASRIPYAIGQVIHHLYANQKDLHAATIEPRFHFQDGLFQVEKGAQWSHQDLEANIWEEDGIYFGGVHSIWTDGDRMEAIGDARRHGRSLVF